MDKTTHALETRKHLTTGEVDRLIEAAKASRNPERNRCILLLMFRHGLRVSELCGLLLSQVNIDERILHVTRLKRGLSTTHPLRGEEIRALRQWLGVREKFLKAGVCPYLFLSERRTPLNRRSVWWTVRKLGEQAGLSLPSHPHMLRHACGYALADQGADTRLIQDFLGHRNIQHTVQYTASNPARFERMWRTR